MKKILCYLLCIVYLIFFFVGCNTGLGEEIDLEPPVLKILSHSNMDYVSSNFTVWGEWSDNKTLKNISVILDDGTEKGTLLNNAVIKKDGTWYADFSFDQNTEVSLIFSAVDKSGNNSVDSVKAITLVVDTVPPELKSFYIKRNKKFNLSLKTVEELKAFEPADNQEHIDSKNKDYFQNEEIDILGSIQENYNLASTGVKLFAWMGEGVEEEYVCDLTFTGDTNYSPCFTFYQSDLAGTSFENQKILYLRPELYIFDAAGNEVVLKNLKYFAWKPDSDKPVIQMTGENGGQLAVREQTDIPVKIFDDDGIDSIEWVIFDNEWNKVFDITDKHALLNDSIEAFGSRDKTIVVSQSLPSGNYWLACRVTDLKTDGSIGLSVTKTVRLLISNNDEPIIVIESPKENEFPDILPDGKSFKLSCYILDNDKAENLRCAIIPYGSGITEAKLKNAKDLLANMSGVENEYSIFITDIDLLEKDAVSDYEVEINEGVKKIYKKTSFSKTFDLTSDFAEKNAVKTLMFYTMDKNGNEVYKTFKIGKCLSAPQIEVSYSESDSDNYDNKLSDITSFEADSTVKFKVSVTGKNNLNIESLSVLCGKEGAAESVDFDSDNYEFSKTFEADTRYEILVEATDVLGNTALVKKTIISTDKVSLNRISSGLKEGIILTKGQKLKVQAEFSGAVTLSDPENAKIKLKNIFKKNAEAKNDDLEEESFAEYISGNGSDTLVFEYEVPEGVFTKKNEKAGSSASIEGTEYSVPDETTDVLEKNSTIYIDAVAPEIQSYSVDSVDVTENTTSISITYDDNLFKETGNITIRRKGKWAVPVVLTEAQFSAVYNSLSDENKICLLGSSSGEPLLDEKTGQCTGAYIKTTHGLVLSGDEYIPDSQTKYVLRFDLNPHDQTGEVQKVREAFESINYHKAEIDVTSSKVRIDGKNVIVSVDEGFFADGREYEIVIAEGCFRDNAGNITAASGSDESGSPKSFWNKKCAVPVIRSERYTHGMGAVEYDENGQNPVTVGDSVFSASTADTTTAPTGYIRVRIDCETPGARILYSAGKTAFDGSVIAAGTSGNYGTSYAPESFTTASSWTSYKTEQNYSDIFVLGSSSFTHSERYYIRAKASAQDCIDSEYGTEGVYKTVIYYKQPGSSGPLFIQGRAIKGGISLISGFPIRDADPDSRFSKACYEMGAGSNNWVLISYEFVSDWYIQSVRTNWQNNNDYPPETAGYGVFFYTYGRVYF